MEYKKDGFINQRAIVLPQSIKEILIHNELTGLLYVTDIGYYPKAKGHFRTRCEGAEPAHSDILHRRTRLAQHKRCQT